MAAKDTKLMVFAHLGTAWAPCGHRALRMASTTSNAATPSKSTLSASASAWPIAKPCARKGCFRPTSSPSSAAFAMQPLTPWGGARPKASIRDEAGVLCLAKFANRHDAFDIPAIECASGAATSPRPACQRPSRTRSPRRFGTSTTSPRQPCGSCFREPPTAPD